jgi:hypothetical protein
MPCQTDGRFLVEPDIALRLPAVIGVMPVTVDINDPPYP